MKKLFSIKVFECIANNITNSFSDFTWSISRRIIPKITEIACRCRCRCRVKHMTIHRLIHFIQLFTIFSNTWCRSAPFGILHQQRTNQIQCMGYCRAGKVWRIKRWLLHTGAVCYNHVWCHIKSHLQKCSQLASWFGPGLWRNSHSALW